MIAEKQPQKQRSKTTKIIFAIIAAAVIAGVIFLIETPWFFNMEYETSNEKDYRKCLRLVNDLPGVTEVFPEEIPANEKDVAFNAYNNIGGRSLKLSFGTKNDSHVAQALPSHKLSSLNDEALVFVLDSEPYRANDFNHAKLVWIVVNEKTKSITFAADSY